MRMAVLVFVLLFNISFVKAGDVNDKKASVVIVPVKPIVISGKTGKVINDQEAPKRIPVKRVSYKNTLRASAVAVLPVTTKPINKTSPTTRPRTTACREGDGKFCNPLPGARVTDDESDHSRRYHGRATAIDLAKPTGTPIYNMFSGVVIAKPKKGRCGNGLIVVSDMEPRVKGTYCHMMAASSYQKGDEIKEGALVGHVGATGSARGSHLHLQMMMEKCKANGKKCKWKYIRPSELPLTRPMR